MLHDLSFLPSYHIFRWNVYWSFASLKIIMQSFVRMLLHENYRSTMLSSHSFAQVYSNTPQTSRLSPLYTSPVTNGTLLFPTFSKINAESILLVSESTPLPCENLRLSPRHSNVLSKIYAKEKFSPFLCCLHISVPNDTFYINKNESRKLLDFLLLARG